MVQDFSVSSLLCEFFEHSYRVQRLPAGSDNTAKQYAVQFRHFARWLGREPALSDFSDQEVARFLRDHLKGRSPYTANKAYWCFYALWNHAADLRLIDKRPTIRPFKEPERIPLAWLIEELRRLLRSCAATPGLIDGIPAGNWWLALHWVWWSTGERCSAAMRIKTGDVNLERGEILIRAEDRKGKTRDALYKLLPQAVETVAAIWSRDRKYLFPFPWSPGTFYHRYTKILLRAGLPTDRWSKPQRMRRSFASHLEANGGNATEALGHSTRRVTRRSYLDPRICGGRNPAELLPSLIDPPDAA